MGALPKALARRGHRVMVVVPRYSNYEEGWETGVRTRFRVFGSDTEVPIPNITFKIGACACCATLHNTLVFGTELAIAVCLWEDYGLLSCPRLVGEAGICNGYHNA